MNRQLALVGLLSLICMMFSTGCSTYKLQGVVVSGKVQSIEVVDSDDERLNSMGIPDASVSGILDPREMRPKLLQQAITDEKGRFVIPIDAAGAGSFQEYDINLAAQAAGFAATTKTIQLPWASKRLLITVVPGRDSYQSPQDVLKETLQMKEQLMR
jgi:hypothetical protein